MTGGLARLWPPLTSAAPTAAGVSGKLTVLNDANGDQVAYNGHLLYTFTSDHPGQVTGQGFQNFFVATPGIPPIAGSSAPAEAARRVVAADLAAAYGPGWRERLVAFDDPPVAAASIGQVHRGRWQADGGQIVDVAVKVQYPGVGKALRSDLRQAPLLARVIARLTRLNVSGLADELAGRIVEELDYVREGRVQTQVAVAFTRRVRRHLP